jgi:hypothetical protein
MGNALRRVDSTPSDESFADVLAIAASAANRALVPYGLMGGIASSIYGRPRWTHDIDLLVRPADAPHVLGVLDDAGFDTSRTDEFWLYKGRRDGVLVDVIFRALGGIYMDDEMIGRIRGASFMGVPLQVLPPEDLVVIKAIVGNEATPRHWGDALGVVANTELDWSYLATRARHGVKRVLSFLVYAQANDLPVPSEAVSELYSLAYGDARG